MVYTETTNRNPAPKPFMDYADVGKPKNFTLVLGRLYQNNVCCYIVT